MKKYKVTIEVVTEYEETIERYRNKTDSTKTIGSLYSVSDDERENYAEYKYPTGKMIQSYETILEQTVDSMELVNVIKAINQI